MQDYYKCINWRHIVGYNIVALVYYLAQERKLAKKIIPAPVLSKLFHNNEITVFIKKKRVTRVKRTQNSGSGF